MANGAGGKTLPDRALDLGQRLGPLGVAGLAFWVLQAATVLAIHPSLDNLASLFGSLGWALTAASVVASLKRLKTMTANNGADAAVGRAVIASQLPGPDLPLVATDPATQKQIDKQVAAASGSNARPANAI